MKWTKEQLEAIEKKGTNIIVSAGAGSGKTAVLTERTIQNLKSFNIDKMIILTFTKAAAFSMKNKIKKAIKNSNDGFLKENLKLIDSASICTFDSFSLDLVKKYSDLLNIDPNIEIADAVIIASLKRKVIDEVFEYYYDDQRFLDFLKTYTVKDDKSIKKDIEGILNNLDKIYNPIYYLDNYFNVFNENKKESFIDEYIKLLDSKYNELKEKYHELTRLVTNEKEEEFASELSNFMTFKSFEDYDLFHNFKLVYRLKGNDELKEKFNEIKAIIEEIKELAIYKNKEEIISELDEANKYVNVIIDILKMIIAKINEYKIENNLYEFNDITRLAIKVLEENKDIRDYYKETIKEIMIDEYQDTNDIGDYFISLIANNNVFMVGDVKQSIYRFRNANPKIFIEKYNNYSEHKDGYKIDLNRNFRSRKEVIDNINMIFSKIMTEKVGGAEYEKDHQMIFGQTSYKEDSNYNLKILNYNKDDYSGFKGPEIEAFIIANDLKNKIDNHYQIFDIKENRFRNFIYSDACILLSTKTEFELYKKVFDYFDIPLTVHKDEDLTYSTELIVIKNIVKLIGYYQGINLDGKLIKTYMSVARSFVLNYSDDVIFKTILASKNGNLFDYIDVNLKNKIVYLSEYTHSHSISELLEEILDVFDVYLKIGTIGDINLIDYKLEHLINIAVSLEKQDYHLEEFIGYLNDAALENIDFRLTSNKNMELGVNIMSIHKSKGLDFNICYFADLNKKFSIKEIKGRFLFTPLYGFIFPVINEGVKPTILKELYKIEYMNEEISERIRLLYVALTRAKENLIFVTDLDESEANHVDVVSENMKMRYSCFKDILESIKYYLKNYIVDTPTIEITREYENIKLKENNKELKDFQTIEINIQKERVEESKFSHSVSELKDNSLLEFGSKIHEYLEYIDFNNFDESLNNLKIDDFFKSKIEKVKYQPFIKENAIYHKEFEFIYDNKHGIIDLLVETDDELIVVDYKLSEINKDYYLDQVRGYINYLKIISNKKITGYLYSLLEEKYLIVEEQNSSFFY